MSVRVLVGVVGVCLLLGCLLTFLRCLWRLWTSLELQRRRIGRRLRLVLGLLLRLSIEAGWISSSSL
jgi:hypothetical protein